MSLEIVRRIRGNVHGTIDVSELENAVISHWVVQRLRRIKQLAFLTYVFPGASHTRFEHSLGVMHLAGVAWERLQNNQRRLRDAASRYSAFDTVELQGQEKIVHGLLGPTFPVMDAVFSTDYNLQVLRLAALLHDLGHPPFSHSGERFLPSWDAVAAAAVGVSPFLTEFFAAERARLAASGRDPGKVRVRHEVFTLLLVDKVLKETYAEYPNLAMRVDPRDVCSVMTTRIAPAPGSPLYKHGAYKLCHELISGELDIDRMDYLLRDSRECGVVYGIFDAGRILDSLATYFDPSDGSLHVAMQFAGLAAFEDYLRARHSMYLQLYFHKTAVGCEAMMQHLAKMLGGWTLPANADAYAEIDEYNIAEKLISAADEALTDVAARSEFKETLKDLLLRRRLWKRAFEVVETAQKPQEKAFETAVQCLSSLGCRFEQVSSSDSLTRFRPRLHNERSQNYLRLIKKDERQFPRVYPIEDFLSLLDDNASVHIRRLYVEGGVDAHGESIPKTVQRVLTAKLTGQVRH